MIFNRHSPSFFNYVKPFFVILLHIMPKMIDFFFSFNMRTTFCSHYNFCHKLSKVVEDFHSTLGWERWLVLKVIYCEGPYSQMRWFFVSWALMSKVLHKRWPLEPITFSTWYWKEILKKKSSTIFDSLW